MGRCNDFKFVKFLLKRNGKYYDKNNNNNYFYSLFFPLVLNHTTPLFVAAVYTKNRDMVDLLIQRGADINTTDKYNATPIMKIYKNNNNLEEYSVF